jgi:outer membrane protein insertion porin family
MRKGNSFKVILASMAGGMWLIAAAGILSAQSSGPVTETTAGGASPQSEVEEVLPPVQSAEDVRAFGPTVKEIEIEYAGPKSVDQSVIRSNMRTAVGQPYSKVTVEEDVRNLYKTGRFANLRIYDEPMGDGVKVIVIVQAKPLVKDLVFAGWSNIKEDRLKREVKTKAGSTLDEKQVSADAKALTDMYQKKGYKDAQVTYKVDQREDTGRATVTFNISEGPRQFIRQIVFEGNEAFTDEALLRGNKKWLDGFEAQDPNEPPTGFKTKKRNWLSWLFGSGVVKDEQMQEDIQNLKRFYQNEGYIDMEVKGVEYRDAGQGFVDVVVGVSEGIRYKVGSLTMEGQALYTEEQIRRRLRMQESAIYSPHQLEKDIKAVKDLYGEQGYVDAQVRPQRVASVESGRMDLRYVINEGPQGFVERIVIQGNNKTKDKVIRRELALAPGDIYNTVRADASKKRLENLNYFEKVDVSPQDTDVPSRKNMVVTVEEKRTGSFTFGAGFSSIDSILGFVELSQSNFDITNWPSFTGAGQRFRIRLQYGAKRQDYVISFVEPYFLDQKLSFGTDVFYRSASYLSSYFDETRYGFSMKLSKPLSEFITARLVYKLENVEIGNVDREAPLFYKEEEGQSLRSGMEIGVTYDNRDSVFLTRRGQKVDLSAELVGGPLLGDVDIYRFGLDAAKYFLLPHDFILTLSGTAATVDSYGDSNRIPLFDRLFAGGSNSIRGFKYREVGPKWDLEPGKGQPIGGASMAYGTVETTFPIMDRVRGAFFVDGGFVNAGAWDFNPADFNVGAGFGLRLNLPIGPLRLDAGFPIISDEYNDSGFQFHFNVGYQF